MYVCICNAISDQQIREAVEQGAADLHAIKAHLGVATGCGTCAEYTQKVIDETLADKLTYAA